MATMMVLGAGLFSAAASASISPTSATLTVNAGSSATEGKTVGVPAVPAKADIEIAIDTTGSMAGAIAQAKAEATKLVNAVQAELPDAKFSVVEFRDAGDTPEYLVHNAMTADATTVQASINSLAAGGGGDFPEAYNLVFNNAYNPLTGGAIGWRSASRKFVVVIGDAPPHGAVTAGFSNCFDTSADPHALNTATELAGVASAQRTLFMVATDSSIKPCYDQLVAGGFSGSTSVLLGSSFADQIVALIKAASSEVADVHLEVASAGPSPASASWISFSPASAGPVSTPATLPFTVNIAVPAGTSAGTYTFDIVAIADGGDIGHQTLTIVVPVSNHDPDCSTVAPNPALLWPPNHKYQLIKLGGATDRDGDPVTLTITSVTQDEPLNGLGDGDTSPDAKTAPSSNSVFVRAERSGTGDGRVYRIAFKASDGRGGTCGGVVTVGVPHDQGQGSVPVDSGLTINSFGP
ncbi:MAG TPA: vWA domain-containing protein [Solirubrobacteraceae bacterium]